MIAGVTIDGQDDLDGLLRAARAVAEARGEMVAAVVPGITTGELDAVGRAVFRRHGARSAPRLTYRFPGSTCISVNDEAAHGVPSLSRQLRAGDLVNLDISAELDGYFSDTGVSVVVGPVTPVAARLLEATRLAQADAMDAARAGARRRNIGPAVERQARHPRLLHHPQPLRARHRAGAPRRTAGAERRRRPAHGPARGFVLAVEPFLSVSATHVVEGDDGWTLCTSDGSAVAQVEHTMVVRHGEPLVLTA
jgi:methionyl aminopeptidase